MTARTENELNPVFDRLYTVGEAAEATRMSVAWWRQAIFQKKVRVCRIGRRVLIPGATISNLLKTGIVEPVNGQIGAISDQRPAVRVR
jgi:hypothetical protein